MGNDDNRYTLLPLPIVRRLFLSDDGYNDLIECAIVDCAKRLYKDDVTDYLNGLNQLVYCWYHEQEQLTEFLFEKLTKLKEDNIFITDYEYKGFGGNGVPDTDIEEDSLKNYISDKEDREFLKAIIEWHRIRSAIKWCKVEGLPEDIMETWNRLANGIPKDTPLCPVSVLFLIRWRDGVKGTTNVLERVKLAMFLGITSIIGLKKKFAFTTKSLILYRMFGCRNKDELDNLIRTDEAIKSVFDKYSTRRMFDKLRNALIRSNLVKVFTGYGRRIIVSTRFDFDEVKSDIAMKIADRTIKDENVRIRKELSKMIDSRKNVHH